MYAIVKRKKEEESLVEDIPRHKDTEDTTPYTYRITSILPTNTDDDPFDVPTNYQQDIPTGSSDNLLAAIHATNLEILKSIKEKTQVENGQAKNASALGMQNATALRVELENVQNRLLKDVAKNNVNKKDKCTAEKKGLLFIPTRGSTTFNGTSMRALSIKTDLRHELQELKDKLKSAVENIEEIEKKIEENNSILDEGMGSIYRKLCDVEKNVKEIDDCMVDNNNTLNLELKQVYKRIQMIEEKIEGKTQGSIDLDDCDKTDLKQAAWQMQKKLEKMEQENKEKRERINLLIHNYSCKTPIYNYKTPRYRCKILRYKIY